MAKFSQSRSPRLENAVSGSATSPMAPPRPVIWTSPSIGMSCQADEPVDGVAGQVGDVRFPGVVAVAVLELGVGEPAQITLRGHRSGGSSAS